MNSLCIHHAQAETQSLRTGLANRSHDLNRSLVEFPEFENLRTSESVFHFRILIFAPDLRGNLQIYPTRERTRAAKLDLRGIAD